MGDPGRPALPAAVAAGDGVSEALLGEVQAWVEQRSNQALHLQRTLEWTLELAPEASLAVRIAAVSHDMERAFPEGSPRWSEGCWADDMYRMAHSERSARIVGDFLRDRAAPEPLVRSVVRLIVVHEFGGWDEADLLQAADSLSFLETIQPVITRRMAAGELTAAGARQWMDYQHGRIRLERARTLGLPLLRAAHETFQQELSSV